MVTGTAIISPIGTALHDVWRMAERKLSGIGELARFKSRRSILCGEVKNFDLEDYISDRRFRRSDLISQYALAAIAGALDGTPNVSGEKIGLVMGITHGALCYTQSFHRDLIEGGPESASPLLFSDSVLNAPAGNASICFGIKGPVHTVIGGTEVSIKAIMSACRMLADNGIMKVVVAAAEEINELSLEVYERIGISPLAEGAGALVLELETDGKRQNCYCTIAGMASRCDPGDPEEALLNVFDMCLQEAGLSIAEIDLVMTSDDILLPKTFKTIPVANLTGLTGQAFAASTIWNVAFCAMALRNGKFPGTILEGVAEPSGNINKILICTADSIGNAAALILSRI
ncbi:MAG TPA: beta-ketoacyl synthase N-terminal-like domain-containing protein [Dissulfurispiraceae bacterium]|nr:beta-ketoacyl synthase N-terminal-like domain-containing protein [Dissulfurispiraceae bacterium]